MALLTVEKRKEYFKELGLEYNEATIKALQRKYMTRKSDSDGIYGKDTDNMLRSVVNTLRYTKNFDPKEFRCTCGKCCGFPSYMKKVELVNAQKIRDHYKKPMIITSGLRCRASNNASRGSIPNSKHLVGYAIDFYMSGVTDTFANRKNFIKWAKKLENTNYIYGNLINSNGVRVSAPYMGNAVHYETRKPVTTSVVAAAATVKPQTKRQKIVAFAKKIASDDSWHYVHWKKNDPKTKECPICHKHPKGKYHGTYCTIFPVMCWHHGGGIKCKCGNCLNNGKVENIYNAKSKAKALKLARHYLGIKDIQVIRSKSGISKKALKPGDMCYYFKGSSCIHAFLYIGKGKMIDANSYKNKKKQIAVRKAMSCKVAIRYVGK